MNSAWCNSSSMPCISPRGLAATAWTSDRGNSLPGGRQPIDTRVRRRRRTARGCRRRWMGQGSRRSDGRRQVISRGAGSDNGAGLLGVKVLHQLGRSLDLREECCHRLALTVDSFGRRAIGGDYDLRLVEETVVEAAAFLGPIAVPHFLQNRAPGLTDALHAGQINSSFTPHFSQNEASPRTAEGAGALRASRGVVDQRLLVAPPSHFVPAWQPYPGGVCHPVTHFLACRRTSTSERLRAPHCVR
jgi:hypothetical protein